MRKFAILLVSTLFVASGGLQPISRAAAQDKKGFGVRGACPGIQDLDSREKIVGGEPAAISNWPGQVGLRAKHPSEPLAFYFCGATAIAPEWLLTAAHCVTGMTRDGTGNFRRSLTKKRLKNWKIENWFVEAVFATEDLTKLSPENVRRIENIVIHERYTSASKSGHDVALIQLKKPMPKPFARLSLKSDTDPRAGALTFAAGYGLTQQGAEGNVYNSDSGETFNAGSAQILEVSVPTVSESACRERYDGAKIGPEQLCAGFEVGGKDTCQGDSGGPLVAHDKNNCPYQIGVVSWGDGCAKAKAYGVYTKVSAYSDWIRKRVPAVTEAHLPARENLVITAAFNQIRNTLAPAKDRATVRIKEGDRIKLGRYVHFVVDSEVAGQLVLIDINHKGEVVQLFPNKHRSSRTIGSGKTITLPDPTAGDNFRFPAHEAGPGRLLAIVAPEKFPAKALIASKERLNKGFGVEAAPTSYIMNLVQQIETAVAAQSEDDKKDVKGWAFASKDYEILQ